MALRTIVIGGRSFTLKTVTLGTARRVPAELALSTDVISRQSEEGAPTAPSPNEMKAMVALIHDAITAAKVDAVSVDELTDLFDDQDLGDGLADMYTAVGRMFERPTEEEIAATKKKSETGNDSGN